MLPVFLGISNVDSEPQPLDLKMIVHSLGEGKGDSIEQIPANPDVISCAIL